MGLAHNFGSVWDLKWCPSGCWEDPSGHGSSEGQSSELRGDARLGLLAMACSDGTVRVMSIPHPGTDGMDDNVGRYSQGSSQGQSSELRGDVDTASQHGYFGRECR